MGFIHTGSAVSADDKLNQDPHAVLCVALQKQAVFTVLFRGEAFTTPSFIQLCVGSIPTVYVHTKDKHDASKQYQHQKCL